MMRFLALVILLISMSLPAQAARGFDTTLGVGTTDRVAIGTYAIATQASVSAWIWINGVGANGNIYRKNSPVWVIGMDGSTILMNFFVTWSGTSGNFTWTAPSTGAWHHIVVAYDGGSTSNKPTVYLDGVAVTVTTATAPVGSYNGGSSANIIGNDNGGSSIFDGKIAEVALWSSLLTANQALSLSQGASPLRVSQSTLVRYLPLYGQVAGEQDWSPNRAAITVTGTKFQSHAPVQLYPAIRYGQ